MKKIPTLFKREFNSEGEAFVINEVIPGMEKVLQGKTIPTVKYDGTAVLILNGKLFCRYDAKRGKNPPIGSIPCCDPDPVTGHWPHWIPAESSIGNCKYQIEAFNNSIFRANATYEVVGPHFRDNPYSLESDILIPHGVNYISDLKGFDFDSIKEWLSIHGEEGIVFWENGLPLCKIKSRDFGINWRENRKNLRRY